MDVTPEDAGAALAEIEKTAALTRRAIAWGGGSALFILWGAIWFVGFLTGQFFPDLTGWVWLVLDVVGIAASVKIWLSGSPVRSPVTRRLALFWFLLFLYGFLWILLLGPPRLEGVQIGAFGATLVMFAYVVMGLWLRSPIIWLGLAVTAVTVANFHLLHPYFYAAMAVTGGGALIGTGLYIRRRWR